MREYELYHANRKHKYIKKIGNRYFYTQQEIAAYLKEKKGDVTFEKNTYDTADGSMRDYRIDFNKHDGGHKKGGWSDGVGIRVGNKKVEVYNTTNKKYEKNPDVKNDTKGRVTTQYAEDGVTRTLDYSNRKTFNKRQKDKLVRERNNIEWLKSKGADVSDAEAELKRDEADFEKRQARSRKRKKAIASTSKHLNKNVKKLKSQTSKGKKAVSNWYKNERTPRVQVIDRVDSRTGKHF